ncbi:MAG: HAMP domain-containing protein [Candidatus Kuenenia sp.]|nr:HAMP domain-containing protein [Candidatus Kuenenia hertensis]
MITWTIRTRLTFWYTCIFGGTLFLFGVLTYFAFSYVNSKSIDIGLKEEADGIIHYAQLSKDYLKEYIERISNESGEEWAHEKYVAILDNTGNIQFISGDIKGNYLPLSSHQIQEILSGKKYYKTVKNTKGHPLRIITMSMNDGLQLIQVGFVFKNNKTSKTFLMMLMSLGGVAIIGSLLGGRWMAKKALDPIDQMIRELQNIETEHLNRRLTIGPVKDEIHKLANVINGMLSRMEDSFKQVRQFTADASHELRTPLAIMKTGIEVALRKSRNALDYQQILANTLDDLGRLSKIVENLFLLARADARRYEIHRERMNLSTVITDISDQFMIVAEAKNISVSIEKAEDVFIEGDELLIRMLFFNLIDNAVKYTSQKGSVSLALHKENGFARAVFKDNGIGISQEEMPHIFDRFYRANKARNADTRGGGLGLSICQWIVKSHHGTISVQSALHKGSTFTVTLPSC